MVVVPSAARQSASERRGSPSAFLCVARQDNGWKDLYAPRSATTLVPPTFYVFPGYGHVFVLLLQKRCRRVKATSNYVPLHSEASFYRD